MPTYTSHGYDLFSAWALPAGTQPGPSQHRREVVHVQRGDVAWDQSLDRLGEGALFPSEFQISGEVHRLFWPILGRVSINRNGRVFIDAAPDAPEGIIAHAILGPVMAHWIMMNDAIALHANCVDIDGKLVAIIGASGAGKSSLSATLVAGGARPHSDDIVSVDPKTAHVPFGTARLKLNPDVLGVLPLNPISVSPVYDGIDKLSVEMPLPVDLSERPLTAVYRLVDAPVGTEPQFERVTGFKMAFTLFSEIFRVNTAALAFGADQLLGRCASLVGRIELFELRRHKDLSRIENLASAVTSHVRSLSRD